MKKEVLTFHLENIEIRDSVPPYKIWAGVPARKIKER